MIRIIVTSLPILVIQTITCRETGQMVSLKNQNVAMDQIAIGTLYNVLETVLFILQREIIRLKGFSMKINLNLMFTKNFSRHLKRKYKLNRSMR